MTPAHLRTGGRRDVGRQVALAIALLLGVIALGTIGYRILGLTLLDALYATVFTVTTVGFADVAPGDSGKVFTILLMLVGTGTVLYALTLVAAAVVEGRFGSMMGRRRMQGEIDGLSGHSIVCGFGRVGKATAHELARAGQDIVVVDVDESRLTGCRHPFVLGSAASDEVLRRAGVARASTLVASLDSDADSIYVTLSARALNPELLIIARSRTEDADQKFLRAGADRVVNPQHLGGDRIAAFALQPHVVEFLDVAIHERGMEFRMEDITVREGSGLAGSTVRATREMEGGGALLLALRDVSGTFVTNPPLDQQMQPGDVIIAIGTRPQLDELRGRARA